METGQRPVSVDDLAAALDLTSGGGSSIGGRPVKVDDLKLVLDSVTGVKLYDGPMTFHAPLSRDPHGFDFLLVCIGNDFTDRPLGLGAYTSDLFDRKVLLRMADISASMSFNNMYCEIIDNVLNIDWIPNPNPSPESYAVRKVYGMHY